MVFDSSRICLTEDKKAYYRSTIENPYRIITAEDEPEFAAILALSLRGSNERVATRISPPEQEYLSVTADKGLFSARRQELIDQFEEAVSYEKHDDNMGGDDSIDLDATIDSDLSNASQLLAGLEGPSETGLSIINKCKEAVSYEKHDEGMEVLDSKQSNASQLFASIERPLTNAGSTQLQILGLDLTSLEPSGELSLKVIRDLAKFKAGDVIKLRLTKELVDALLPILASLNSYLTFVVSGGEDEVIKRFCSMLPSKQILVVESGKLIKQLEVTLQQLKAGTFVFVRRSEVHNLRQYQQFLAQLPEGVRLLSRDIRFPPNTPLGRKLKVWSVFKEEIKAIRQGQTERVLLSRGTTIDDVQAISRQAHTVYAVDHLSEAQVQAFPKSIKSVCVNVTASANFLQLLKSHNINITYHKQMGISQKYLSKRPFSLMPFHEQENTQALSITPNSGVPTTFIPFKKISELSAQTSSGLLLPAPYEPTHMVGIARSDITLRYETNCGTLTSEDLVVFVFAGRVNEAFIPPSDKTRIVVVVTADEFDKIKPSQQASYAYDFLIISNIKKPYKETNDPIGTISSRRYAALYNRISVKLLST